MKERRKNIRARVLKGAKLILGTSSVRDCLVRDLTDSGAGVEVPNTIELPEALNLTMNTGRVARRCRVVWRKINKTGLEFG
jgi:hypothetical protein